MYQHPALKPYLGLMGQPYVTLCPQLQLMSQTDVTKRQTNQTNPPQVNCTKHMSDEEDKVKLHPITEETPFFVGCHYTLMEPDDNDDEPQPAAHQAYMMEQDNEDDDDWYTWGSATASEQRPEPFEFRDEDMNHVVITTKGNPGNLMTTGDKEDDILTETWENTHQSFSKIECIETEQQVMPFPPNYTYQKSTDSHGGIQVILFVGKVIPEVSKVLKQWHDKDGYPVDPIT